MTSTIITANAIIPKLPSGITHDSTTWQISTDNTFNTIDINIPNDNVSKTSLKYITNLQPPLYIRYKLHLSNGDLDFSQIISCVSNLPTPILTIQNYPNNVPTNPDLFINTYNGTGTHTATDWIIIEKNTNIEVWSSFNDSVNLTSISVPNDILVLNKNYKALSRYVVGSDYSKWAVVDFKVSNSFVTIQTPSIYISGFPNEITVKPNIQTSSFNLIQGTDIHVSTDWIIYKVSDLSIVFQSLNDTTNLTNINIPNNVLELNTSYLVKVRHKGQFNSSSYGELYFNTMQDIILKPTLTLVGNENELESTPSMTSSNFISFIQNEVHVSSDWIIEDSSNNVVYSNTNDTNNLTSFTVPQNILNYGNTYFFKVRYNSINFSSEYSDPKQGTILTPVIINPVVNVPDSTTEMKVNDLTLTCDGFFYISDNLEIHLFTDWLIEDTNGNIIFSSLNDTANLLSIDIPNGLIQPGQQYIIKVRFKTVSGLISNYTILNVTAKTIVIQTPTLNIQGEPNNIFLFPFITGSNFNVNETGRTHQSTDWWIEDTNNNIVWSSFNDIYNLTSISVTTQLQENTSYVLKAKYRDNTGLESNEAIYNFTTAIITVADPIFTIDTSIPNQVTPIITGSSFSTNYVLNTHVSTDWIIKDTNGNIIWSSLNDTNNLTSIQVPSSANLANSTTYELHAKYNGFYKDSNNVITTFTTG